MEEITELIQAVLDCVHEKVNVPTEDVRAFDWGVRMACLTMLKCLCKDRKDDTNAV